MSSPAIKRPNKRSLVGIRVAAKRESGFYEAGSIIDTTSKLVVTGPDNLTSSLSLLTASNTGTCSSSTHSTGHKVLISFDDGTKAWYSDRHVVGPGFQGPSSASLTIGQTVYCTVGHRETAGKIRTLPSSPGGEVFQVSLDDGSGQVITRKQEDMRLIKSRKSSRIIADKDYHSLASGKTDFDSTADTTKEVVNRLPTATSRKRAVPVDIVRSARNHHVSSSKTQMTGSKTTPRVQKSHRDLEDELLYAPLINEFVDVDSEESLGELEEAERRHHRGNGELMMDECSAALVLMSLGNSPGPRTFDMQEDAGFSSASFPGGFASSWPAEGSVERLSHSLHQVESGRQHSPVSIHDSTTASSSDEGIEIASSMQIDPCHLDHDYSSAWTVEAPDYVQHNVERPRKRRPSNSVVAFQCTWPKCQHMESSRTTIKRHIQTVHFMSAGLPAEDLEFYYNEIDTNESTDETAMPWASMSHSESKSRLSVASTSLPMDRSARHRHRSALSASSDNAAPYSISKATTMPKPIAIPRSIKRFDSEWESASAPQSAASPALSEAFSTVSSSFGSGISKKIRDIKKCRKVYGMDNREMWCTQCKWKKACTRFAME